MKRAGSGFSLTEMLTVISVVMILTSMSAPLLSSFPDRSGVKESTRMLLDRFEQARLSALSSGGNTYVGFANETTFPASDSPYPYRAFILFRDRTDDDPGTGNYVALSPWIFLSRNVSFKQERYSVIGDPAVTLPYSITSDGSLPGLGNGAVLPAMVFTPAGSIAQPLQAKELNLYLYEEFYSGSKERVLRPDQNFLERISFRRYTGRAESNTVQANPTAH